jgi:hypothetical protein
LKHLAVVRRVFLLEAGDLIFDLTSQIFARLESLETSRDSGPSLWSDRRSDFHLGSILQSSVSAEKK